MSQQDGTAPGNIDKRFVATKFEVLASGFNFTNLTPLHDIYAFLSNLESSEVGEVPAEGLDEVSPHLVLAAIAFGLPLKAKDEFFIDVICPTDDGRVVRSWLRTGDVANQILRFAQAENLPLEMVGNMLFHYGSVGLQDCYTEFKIQGRSLRGNFAHLTRAASISDYKRSTYLYIQYLGQAIINAAVSPITGDFANDFCMHWKINKPSRSITGRIIRTFPS